MNSTWNSYAAEHREVRARSQRGFEDLLYQGNLYKPTTALMTPEQRRQRRKDQAEYRAATARRNKEELEQSKQREAAMQEQMNYLIEVNKILKTELEQGKLSYLKELVKDLEQAKKNQATHKDVIERLEVECWAVAEDLEAFYRK